MNFTLGLKSDPIEYRYSFDWLFELMAHHEIKYLQFGSFLEIYHLPDRYFTKLKERAANRGIRIKSCFTAHRELGGFFTGDPDMETVAHRNYARFLEIATLLGADYAGSNPGAVYRDRMAAKTNGIDCYLSHMTELMGYAKHLNLNGLTVEPMSCLAEPPSTAGEIVRMMATLHDYHRQNQTNTVPVYLCGDISHGLADQNREIVADNMELFTLGIPYMAEFHLKNTDPIFNATFGFGPEECKRGIVDLAKLKELIFDPASLWPVTDVTGYLEISGPKTGRDYTDKDLGKMLGESLSALRRHFGGPEQT